MDSFAFDGPYLLALSVLAYRLESFASYFLDHYGMCSIVRPNSASERDHYYFDPFSYHSFLDVERNPSTAFCGAWKIW